MCILSAISGKFSLNSSKVFSRYYQLIQFKRARKEHTASISSLSDSMSPNSSLNSDSNFSIFFFRFLIFIYCIINWVLITLLLDCTKFADVPRTCPSLMLGSWTAEDVLLESEIKGWNKIYIFCIMYEDSQGILQLHRIYWNRISSYVNNRFLEFLTSLLSSS